MASLLILVCSTGPRLLVTALADPQRLLAPDSYTYLPPAYNLVQEGAFLNSNKQVEVSRTPGYPAFLAAIMAFTGRDWGGRDLGKILFVQTIIVSCYGLLVYWLARRIVPPLMAFVGALCCAFSPWGIVLAGQALSEGLYLLVLSLIFLGMKLVEETKGVFPAILGAAVVGLLTAAAVLIRPLWPLTILVAVALFVLYGPKRKGSWLVLTMTVICSVTPILLWTARNWREADIVGLGDHGGKVAWQYLAARVDALASGQDRFAIQYARMLEEQSWTLSAPEADHERWKRANAVFRDHPLLTVYSFALNALEHTVHPSPDILAPVKLNFSGDYWVLAVLWGGCLVLAYIGWRCQSPPSWDAGSIDHQWLVTLLGVCLALTLASGMTMGAGSRMRAPLELIIPLLAGIGLVRVIELVRVYPRVRAEAEVR